MSHTLEQILSTFEQGNQPDQTKVASAEVNTPDFRKLAADLDAEGRQMAHGFIDELSKLAVGVSELTPNTAAVPDNPAIQVSNADAHEGDVAKVEAIVKKLTLGGEQKVNPSGVIHEQNTPVAATDPIVVDEHPVAADVAKQAAADIIGRLYEKYFG
jgi:hypothetical protein